MGTSHEFVGSTELQFLYLDRIHGIDWIYCFLCFQPPAHRGLRPGGTKQRNGNPAFSTKEELKKLIVLLPKELPGRGLFGFAFLQERQKILRIL